MVTSETGPVPSGLSRFVVPDLQRLGIYLEVYAGATLRKSLACLRGVHRGGGNDADPGGKYG